jgi:hypothetical protein
MKRIIQSHRSPEIHRNHREDWQAQNPEWEYLFFDNDEARSLIKQRRPELMDVYDKLVLPVQRADLFRYVAVHSLGGLWTDVDTVCYAPLDSYLDVTTTAPYVSPTFVSAATKKTIAVSQWTFWAPAGNPHLERVIQHVAARVRKLDDRTLEEWSRRPGGTLQLTGPDAMDMFFARRTDVNYLPKSAWGYYPNDRINYSQVKALHLFDRSWVPNL